MPGQPPDRAGSHNLAPAIFAALKADPEERFPDAPLVRQACALLERAARKQGLGLRVDPPRDWGLPDLDLGAALFFPFLPLPHAVKPWNLNVALGAGNTPVHPDPGAEPDLVVSLSKGEEGVRFGPSKGTGRAGDLVWPGGGPLEFLSFLQQALAHPAVARDLADRRRRALDVARNGPLVTVLVPTHDRLEFLPRAVESVLAQTWTNLELLVIQDAGPDVREALAGFGDDRLTLLKQPKRRGKSAALNAGLACTRGGHVAYLDDDDIWLPGHLEDLMRFLLLLPGARMAYSNGLRRERVKTPGGWGKAEGSGSTPYCEPVGLEDILEHNAILGITVAHERSLLEETGPFDERLEVLVDFDMWRRMAALTRPCHVSLTTAEYFVWSRGGEGESRVTDMAGGRPVRYAAQRWRVLSKPLPGGVGPDLRESARKARRRAGFDFLLLRGADFAARGLFRRALASLALARKYLSEGTRQARRLGVGFLEAGDPVRAMALLSRCLRNPGERLPVDYLLSALAALERSRPDQALALLDRMEREADPSKSELELARSYRARARPGLGPGAG